MTSKKALVLSGGGLVGIAWQAGVVSGLMASGIPLDTADLVVGTSAGSMVGAALTLRLDVADLIPYLAQAADTIAASSSTATVSDLFDTMADVATTLPPREARQALGRLAGEATTMPEDDFVATFPIPPDAPWPRNFACTAVDAETGEPQVWRFVSGVPVQRAVASSCAAPLTFPLVTIGGRRYMDGGVYSNLSTGVAGGYASVIAVSCLPIEVDSSAPAAVAALAATSRAELAELRRDARFVETVTPDAEFLELSGSGIHMMDPARVRPAFESGARQARSAHSRLLPWAR